MKTIIITLALATLALTSCTTSKLSAADYSWQAFCNQHGYSLNDNSNKVVNEYLDTWCGSTAEEAALLAAGYQL